MITATNISLTHASNRILQSVDFDLQAGECVGLIGPNGAGKTSLLRALLRLNTQATGACNLWDMNVATRAKMAAWLAQDRNVVWNLSVREVVELGRTPWAGFAGHPHPDNQAHIDAAILRLGLSDFIDRPFATLSGGERARVAIARILAQNTGLIMADEPIAALDPGAQMHVMGLFRDLATEGRGVVVSIHDLGLAARYCTRLILMDHGRIIAAGEADKVLSDQNLAQVFGIEVFRAKSGTYPIIQPINSIEEKP